MAPCDVASIIRQSLTYGGARFEFRAAGSSQNVSMVNVVLNTMAAEAFKIVADRIEAGA
jgi:glutamine synthetase